MGAKSSPFARSLLRAEIRRLVASAAESGHIIAAAACAAAIHARFPDSGLDRRDIENEIVMAAARAGVAVEFGGEADPGAYQPPAPAALAR